jgi:CheY-like chemotaxis protein
LSALLRLIGHEVRTAYDGFGAVEVAGEFEPQVVLLDIALPRLNEEWRAAPGWLGFHGQSIAAPAIPPRCLTTRPSSKRSGVAAVRITSRQVA